MIYLHLFLFLDRGWIPSLIAVEQRGWRVKFTFLRTRVEDWGTSDTCVRN